MKSISNTNPQENNLTTSMYTHYTNTISFIQDYIGIPLPIVPKNEDIFDDKGKLKFTGKNTSFYQKNGEPTLISTEYVDKYRQSYFDTELPLNIGAYITQEDKYCIDIDCKTIPHEKDKVLAYFLKKLDSNTYVEQTQNKGYHIVIECPEKLDFSLYTLPGYEEHKIGEILGNGRFIVTAPSSYYEDGRKYEIINHAIPLRIDSWEQLGIIPYKEKSKNKPRTISSLVRKPKFKDFIKGDFSGVISDGSNELTAFAKYMYGERNKKRKYEVIDDVDEVIEEVGIQLLDSDNGQLMRVLKSIDADSCIPAINQKEEVAKSDTELVDLLVDELENSIAYSGKERYWYRYNDELLYWEKCTDEHIIMNIISDTLISLDVGKINRRHIQDSEWLLRGKLRGDFELNPNLIPLTNGVLDIKAGELILHSPKLMLTYNSEYPYAEGEDCPIAKQFLLDLAGSDKSVREVLRAYLNACIKGRNFKRFIHLLGRPNSGKSAFMNLATALVGRPATYSTSLNSIETNRFETSTLKNKKLCLFPEQSGYSGSVSVFKAMTGHDFIRNEVKGKQQENGLIYKGMVLLASNDPLKTKEYVSGLADRRITIKCDHKVSEDKKRNLIKLGDRSKKWEGDLVPELPHILNWVLSMSDEEVEKLILHTCKYVPSLVSVQREALANESALAAWADENLIHETNAKAFIGDKSFNVSEYLYSNYCEYSSNSGNHIRSKQTFSDDLRSLLKFYLKIETEKKRNSKGYYFSNIRLRTPKDTRISTLITKSTAEDELVLTSNSFFLIPDDENPYKVKIPKSPFESDDIWNT